MRDSIKLIYLSSLVEGDDCKQAREGKYKK